MTIAFLYRTIGDILLFTPLPLRAGMWQAEQRKVRPT